MWLYDGGGQQNRVEIVVVRCNRFLRERERERENSTETVDGWRVGSRDEDGRIGW